MSKIEKTVFISYRRTNSFHALAIYQALRARGYDVFIDYASIDSGKFDDIILNQIKARAHFIVILTPSALERCD
ncbi:MAG TPA: toll/interleukin-1 receptor domain-containing protein, partial [Aggregatilineales bacterium]|nr:toll/interleukin-1 receptor domain-containing protein [Aggregatilineales bacterium]